MTLNQETKEFVTRREFLNYAWLASIALFTVENIGLGLWFALPNNKTGQFGTLFPIGTVADSVPQPNTPPKPFDQGKFWLANVDQTIDDEQKKGVLALYKVCTHLGCLYEWDDSLNHFKCPCHGSAFELAGDYITGPARRNLDRFIIIAQAPDGSERTSENGEPLIVNDNDMLIVDTGRKILGSTDIVQK